MPNEVDDIVQNIVLNGDEQVVAAFERIREAGERSFEGISKAIEHSALSFTGMATAITGVVASIGIVSVGMFEFVKSTEEGISALSDLAAQAGTTTEEMSGIKAAFASGGVASGQLEIAFRRLSVTLQQSWTEIKQASRQSADQLKGDALAVSNAQLALADALRKQGDVERDQALQSRTNTNSVAEAQLHLNELRSKQLASRGFDTSNLDAQLSKTRQLLDLKQAQIALEEAQKKQEDDELNAANEKIKVENAAQQAQLALNQARRKEQDDQKNDITNVIAAVKKVAAGDGDALKSINASAENLVKGIIGTAGDASKALGELRGDVSDLASPAPGVKATFEALGQVLKNIEDPALKTAIAYRLLGRNISQAEINVISSTEKMEEFKKRVEELGLAVDKTDKKVSEHFREALFGLQNDIQLVSDKLATAFGPGFTTILKAIDDALINNRQSIIAFAESIASRAVPVVESFIRVLTNAAEPRDQWLVDYIDKIKSFGSGLGSLIGIVTKVFEAIGAAAGAVANALNSVFGTSLNAVDVLFAAWFIRISTGFIAMRAAAESAATGIEVAFATVAARFGLLAAAIYTAVKAFEAIKAFFGIGEADKSAEMWQGAEDRLKAIAQILSGDIKGGIDAWIKAGEEQTKKEQEKEAAYKASSETRKQTTDAVLGHEKSANAEAVDSHKSARNQIDNDSHSSAEKRIADNKRVADSEKKGASEAKEAAEDTKKAAQTQTQPKQNKDGSFIDENGIKIFGKGSPSGGITDENGIKIFGSSGGGSIGSTIVGNIIKQVADKLGVSPSDVEALGNTGGAGGKVFGDQNSFKVIHPDVIEKPPLPRERPIEADGLSKQIVDDLLNTAEQGRFKPESLTPPFRPAGAFPQLPLEPAPLTGLQPPEQPEQIHKTFSDLLEPLKPIADFLRSAVTDPGALQEKQRPEAAAPPPPEAATEAVQQTSLLQSMLDAFHSLATSIEAMVSRSTEGNTVTDPGTLGVRGDAGEKIDSAFETAASSIESGAQSIVAALQNAASNIAAAGSAAQASAATVNAAEGGWVRGPGGPTGDKIHAMLSDEEFVHSARATRFWGVDFMHSINNLQMPRFSLGGLVGLLSPQLPRFASGGPVSASGGGLPHIGTVDLTTNHGTVRVAVDGGGLGQLRRASVMRNMGKGPQPSWVK